MEYHEAAAFLRSLRRHRPKLGTETTAELLSHLGDPHAGIECVQIAGSNGKGSTARMLESVLREAGLDVGLFTSPGLADLREQVRVNGRKVPRSRLARYAEALEPRIERLRAEDDAPTHFEVLTALAVHHFGVEDVDVAVLEVGIGGRYDATSAVDPVASAVTSVSLEHTDLLGDTVEEIARDLAQVAPTDRPLVTAADGPALAAIRGETDVVTVGGAGADVTAAETGMASRVESEISLTGPDWALEARLPLPGSHQARNAGVAATLARQVASVDPDTIADGLRAATWPGRFELVEEEPTVVLDGAHNPAAVGTVRELLDRHEYDDLRVVFGVMADKDYEAMIAELPPVSTAVVTRPDVDRAESVDALAAAFEGHADRVERVESVAEATERAVEGADEDDLVLVVGSLYAVVEARDRWTRLVVPKGDTLGGGEAVFSGAAFTDADPDAVDYRSVATTLRPGQAARVAARAETVGVDCHRSATGAPGDYVATVLAGSLTRLRALVAELEGDRLGLSRFAHELRTTLDGSNAPEPFAGPVPAVMGVLNVTPDSFYDGGEYDTHELAVERAEELVAAGADIVDVGGESTRPGADPVSVEEERARVVPVIESLDALDVPVSVDTRKAAVAEAALEAGADIVNDVSGLSDPAMRHVVADHDAGLILMHSLSAPVDPGRGGGYDDVVDDVLDELAETVRYAERAGVDRERIVVDPGCGFGKDAAESFELVERLGEFRALGCPVMVGHSRKSMFERVDCASGERLPPTLAVTALAAERGADVVRVHDVAENAAVLRTVAATTRTLEGHRDR